MSVPKRSKLPYAKQRLREASAPTAGETNEQIFANFIKIQNPILSCRQFREIFYGILYDTKIALYIFKS